MVIHLSFNKQNKFQRKNGPERTYERLAVSKIKPTWKLTILVIVLTKAGPAFFFMVLCFVQGMLFFAGNPFLVDWVGGIL